MSNETTTDLDLHVEEVEALDAPLSWEWVAGFAAGVAAGVAIGVVVAT
jgi:hypothetical protein